MTNMAVYARIFDMSKWFQQLAAAPLEWWKAFIFTDEGYQYDRREQMGRTIGAHLRHKLESLIVEIIEERAESQYWSGVGHPNTHASNGKRHTPRRWT